MYAFHLGHQFCRYFVTWTSYIYDNSYINLSLYNIRLWPITKAKNKKMVRWRVPFLLRHPRNILLLVSETFDYTNSSISESSATSVYSSGQDSIRRIVAIVSAMATIGIVMRKPTTT